MNYTSFGSDPDLNQSNQLLNYGPETNSYTSLAGFGEPLKTEDYDPTSGLMVNPAIIQQVELQARINEMAEKLVSENRQVFIRPCKKLSVEEQIQIFGELPSSVSEVLSESGSRILLVGVTNYWKNFCNLNEPPLDAELQRYILVNSEGEKMFQCSIYSEVVKISMGKLFIGQMTMKIQTSLDCTDWEPIIMIVEDHQSDQVFRFEKNKTFFDVLMYPEQLPICSFASSYWSSKKFPWIKKRIFGVPLPEELGCRKKVLLLTGSIYIYQKYYQRSRKCQIFMGTFAIFSLILIITLVVLQRLGLLEALAENDAETLHSNVHHNDQQEHTSNFDVVN